MHILLYYYLYALDLNIDYALITFQEGPIGCKKTTQFQDTYYKHYFLCESFLFIWLPLNS